MRAVRRDFGGGVHMVGLAIAILVRRGSRGGRPGRDLEFVPMRGWSVPIGGLVFVGF